MNEQGFMLLKEDLLMLAQFLDYELFIAQGVSKKQVSTYFDLTDFFYRYFHSRAGAMHFPLYLEGGAAHHAEGLYAQAAYIAALIEGGAVRHVSEMGAGMGFNTLALAKKYPQVTFRGLDPSLAHLRFATKQAKGLGNISYIPGEWHAPQHWSAPTDLLFAVESFCYTKDLKGVFQGAAKALSAQGQIVIFDSFRTAAYPEASQEVRQAVQLSALGFSVEAWWDLEEVIEEAALAGFYLVSKQDFSVQVMPNLLRFQRDMRALCQQSWFQRLVRYGLVPTVWLGHVLSGLFGAHGIGSEAQGYFCLHFQKDEKWQSVHNL